LACISDREVAKIKDKIAKFSNNFTKVISQMIEEMSYFNPLKKHFEKIDHPIQDDKNDG